jgi:hypothetical protein
MRELSGGLSPLLVIQLEVAHKKITQITIRGIRSTASLEDYTTS